MIYGKMIMIKKINLFLWIIYKIINLIILNYKKFIKNIVITKMIINNKCISYIKEM